MPLNDLNLQYQFFVVDERPLCLWDEDIKRKTLKFLESVDPSYFEYMMNVHLQTMSETNESSEFAGKDLQHAALALRSTYSQALETLFALIFAATQAPWCVPAWINAYNNGELRNLVNKVDNKQPVLSLLDIETPSWTSISEFLYRPLDLEDKEKESSLKAGFAQIWSHFALDFLDKGYVREYNSIKHGLRMRSGGFEIKVGIPDELGVPPPAEKMVVLSSSEFGSSYFTSEKLGEWGHHIRLKGELRNWDPKNIAWGIELAAMSISNVQSALKLMNGVSAAQFRFPSDLSTFNWRADFMNMTTPEIRIAPDFIAPFTKKEVLSGYKARNISGIRRLTFINEEEASTD